MSFVIRSILCTTFSLFKECVCALALVWEFIKEWNELIIKEWNGIYLIKGNEWK